MAYSDNADIRVLVGVEGDAKIDQGSGKIIKDTLVDIASQISKQKLVKISVHLADDVKTTLQQELSALAKDLKLDVSTSPGGLGGSSNGGSKGGAKKSTKRNVDYTLSNLKYANKELQRLETLYAKIRGFDKTITFDVEGSSFTSDAIEQKYGELKNVLQGFQVRKDKIDDEKISAEKLRGELERLIDAYNRLYKQSHKGKDGSAVTDGLNAKQAASIQKTAPVMQRLETAAKQFPDDAEIQSMVDRAHKIRDTIDQMFTDHVTTGTDFTKANNVELGQQEALIAEIGRKLDSNNKKREQAIEHEKQLRQRTEESAAKSAEQQAKQGSVWKQDNQAQIDELAKLFQQAKDNKIDLGDVSANTQSALTEAKRILERLNDTNGVVTDDMKHDWREVNKDIKKCTTDLTALLKANEHTPEASSQALAMQARLQQYLRTVSPQAISEFSSEIKTINSLLSEKTPAANEKARLAFQNLQSAMRSLGYEGGNYITVLYNKVKAFGAYLLSSKLTTVLTSAVNNTIKNVIELDKALTDLQIVTGDTTKASEEMLLTYNKMARDLGTTTMSVANAGVEWLRQGYSVAETNELIQNSMVLSTVGMMESADAATALTAAMKGYSLEAADAMSVVDKFTSIDMVAATSAGNLATALSKTAANAKSAGLNLNDVIAQLAVVNETMQEDPESTGTFYNTMLSRMAAIKSGRLEDPETGESLSDVEKTLSGLDIKLRDSNEEFRNFGDVLNEVGKNWSSFSSVQQRAIASAFAGTRQQTRFLTLMEGWGDALRYAGIAADSAGTAMQKFETYQESLEAKANRATAAFEKMSDALLPEDVIGTIYDMGTALATLFSTDVGAFGVQITAVLGALVTAGGTLKSFQASGIGKNIIGVAKDLGWPETTGDIIVPIYAKKAA